MDAPHIFPLRWIESSPTGILFAENVASEAGEMIDQPPKGPRNTRKGSDYPGPEKPQHRPEGREHQVHREILERRMRGGPEPTPEAYRRALEQWKKLPGSKIRPPSDIVMPLVDDQPEPGDQPKPPPSEPKAEK